MSKKGICSCSLYNFTQEKEKKFKNVSTKIFKTKVFQNLLRKSFFLSLIIVENMDIYYFWWYIKKKGRQTIKKILFYWSYCRLIDTFHYWLIVRLMDWNTDNWQVIFLCFNNILNIFLFTGINEFAMYNGHSGTLGHGATLQHSQHTLPSRNLLKNTHL